MRRPHSTVISFAKSEARVDCLNKSGQASFSGKALGLVIYLYMTVGSTSAMHCAGKTITSYSYKNGYSKSVVALVSLVVCVLLRLHDFACAWRLQWQTKGFRGHTPIHIVSRAAAFGSQVAFCLSVRWLKAKSPSRSSRLK